MREKMTVHIAGVPSLLFHSPLVFYPTLLIPPPPPPPPQFSVLCRVFESPFRFLSSFQNVFSKKLLSNDHPYSPPELQFYTSVAAIAVQLPFWFFMVKSCFIYRLVIIIIIYLLLSRRLKGAVSPICSVI